MTAPAFIAMSALTSFGSGNCPRPSVIAGDLMLMCIGREAGDAGGAMTSTGWTPVAWWNPTNVFNVSLGILRKIATGSEPADYACSASANTGKYNISVYRGVDPTTPLIDVQTSNNSTPSNNMLIASCNAGSNVDSMLFAMYGSGTSGQMTPSTPDAAMTERLDGPQSGLNVNWALADQVIAASGATGTRTATGPGTPRDSFAFSFLIASPQGGGGGGVTLSQLERRVGRGSFRGQY